MAKNLAKNAGKDAVKRLGWWRANRFLVWRRISQLGVLAAFLSGPYLGFWLFEGNLSSSLLLDTVPFSDPLLMAQSLLAGHWPETQALIGLAVVVGFYSVVSPRLFCGWVCPVNLVTDLAAWLRRKLGLKGSYRWSKSLRYWFLASILVGSAVSGSVLWFWLDPVSAVYRILIFGASASAVLLVLVFLVDLLVVEHGWCGYLCPLGAMYGLIGKKSLMRVAVTQPSACTLCMDCFNVCPEPQVLRYPLMEKGLQVADKDCMSCGRCIDVCAEQVLEFRIRDGAENET